MKKLFILTVLIVLSVYFSIFSVNAETLTTLLGTVNVDKEKISVLLERPEIKEYAESINRIGNIIQIKWNDYDIEAISINNKELKQLGCDPIISISIDNEDSYWDGYSLDIFNFLRQLEKNIIHESEIEAFVYIITSNQLENLDNFVHSVTIEYVLNYNYELGKELMIYMQENYEIGAYNMVNQLRDYALKNNKIEDAVSFLEELKTLDIQIKNEDKPEIIEDIDKIIAELKEKLKG